jgi:hypothetical protein
VFAAAVVTLLSLFTNANVSVGFINRSNTTLQNLVVSCPDFDRSPDVEMVPGNSFAFSAKTRSKFDIRISFDPRGQHYDIPSRVRLAPLGDYMVSLSLDDRMRLSVETRVL